MTKQWVEGAVVIVKTNDLECPSRFIWKNKLHRTVRILEEWEVNTLWWEAGRIWCVCYSVITDDGTLSVIYQNLLDGKWYFSTLYD